MIAQTKFKLLAAILVAILLAGCAQQAYAGPEYTALPPATAVEVRSMQRTALENSQNFIGRVEAASTVSVISRLSAEVTGVYAQVGQRVEEGDILFTVDTTDVDNQIRQLQAGIAAQEAGIAVQEAARATANIGVNTALYGLYVAQNGSAQAELQRLQSNFNVEQALLGLRDARDAATSADDRRRFARDDLYVAERALRDALDSGVGFEEAMGAVIRAEANLAAAEAVRDQTRSAVRRAESAMQMAQDSQPLTIEVLEDTQDQAIRRAELGVEQAQAGVSQVQAGISQARAGINTSNIQLEIARDALYHAEVRSPISGVIATRMVEVGQMVAPQMAPFTIVSMDTVYVSVGVTESLINRIFPGDQVSLSIQAISYTPLTGVVEVVSPVATPMGTYTVRIALPNPDGLIRPGMFAQASFVLEAAQNAFVLDRVAVLSDSGESFVYVVRGDIAERVPVTLGISDGERVEILTGISAGDIVVVTGQEFLRDGQRVNVVGER